MSTKKYNNKKKSNGGYPIDNGGDSNVLDDEDDENIDAFFASMNESPSYPGASGYQDGDMPEDILQEILNLQMDEETIVAPPSPKMNVGAGEFVPGQGIKMNVRAGEFVPGQGIITAVPPAPPAVTESASGASTSVAAAVPSDSTERATTVTSSEGSADAERRPTEHAVRDLVNREVFSMVAASNGTLNMASLSFKDRLKVIPAIEGTIKSAYPAYNGRSFKPYLKMELRNFVAESLRPWEANPAWYTPPS